MKTMTWEQTLEKMGVHFGVTFAVMAAIEQMQILHQLNPKAKANFAEKYGEDATHIIQSIEIPK